MRPLQTEAFVKADNRIFASCMIKNGLYVYDMYSHKTRLLGLFEEYERYEWRLHCAAGRYKNDVYFFPDRSKGIYKLNICSCDKDYIPLEIEDNARFTNGFIVGGNAYCIQVRPVTRIISVDLNTYKQSEINISGLPDDAYLQRDYYIENRTIYLTDRKEGFLVSIDCDRSEGKAEQVIPKNKISAGFGTVCKLGSEFFFSAPNGVVVWNSQTKETRWITDFPESFGMIYRDANGDVKHVLGTGHLIDLNEQPFSSSFYKDGRVYFLPRRTNSSLALDVHTKKLTCCFMNGETESMDTLLSYDRLTQEHFLASQNEGKYYFFSSCSNRIYSEDSFLEGKWIVLEGNEPGWAYSSGQDLIVESYQSTLSDLLECLTERQNAGFRTKRTGNSYN